MTAETPGTPLSPEPFCPCAGKCHHSEAPCSLGCWAAQKPWRVEEAVAEARERRERVDPDPEWHKANSALPSMRCVCGHWDTEHAAFVSKVRPGRTRTFCDHCDCRSWMTPEDERAMNAARSRATDLLEATK